MTFLSNPDSEQHSTFPNALPLHVSEQTNDRIYRPIEQYFIPSFLSGIGGDRRRAAGGALLSATHTFSLNLGRWTGSLLV